MFYQSVLSKENAENKMKMMRIIYIYYKEGNREKAKDRGRKGGEKRENH